ncbi:MAG: ABC transporter ATP-binding protein [Candidatus Hydrothermarchaeaceae archaeon]
MTASIVVKNVSKKFRIPAEKKDTAFGRISRAIRGQGYRRRELQALKDISFEVGKGETLAIIGENGSGKSTLLKIIADVIQPDTGYVKTEGKIAPFLELGVGFHDVLTARENVYLYGAILGMSKREIDEKYDDIFDFAELRDFENVELKKFSSGMYVRLAFATAMATNPDIFLIDEILAAGDFAFRKKCFDKFEDFKKEGKTIIFVSHALGVVKKMFNEAILIDKGVIISRGPSEEVVHDYLVKVLKKEKDKQDHKPTSVGASAGRWGSGEMEISSVQFFDKNRRETYLFSYGDEMTVRIEYRVNKKVAKPIFRAQIARPNGMVCHEADTNMSGIELGEVSKDGAIELVYNALTLPDDAYKCSIGIFDSENNAYDRHEMMYPLVIDTKTENVGTTRIEHAWKV